MNYRKCLVDAEGTDDEVKVEFGKIHAYLSEWINTRSDKLSVPTAAIIRYIVACYDPESPVVKEYGKKWTAKKREAAKISGLLKLKGALAEAEVGNILYCENSEINKVVVRYLAAHFDRDFLMYAIYNELLVNLTEQLIGFKFDKPGDILKAKENIELVQADIVKTEQKILSGDDVRALKNILTEETTKFLVKDLRPESLVTKKEKGEQVVESPYGDDYKVEKLTFIDDQ